MPGTGPVAVPPSAAQGGVWRLGVNFSDALGSVCSLVSNRSASHRSTLTSQHCREPGFLSLKRGNGREREQEVRLQPLPITGLNAGGWLSRS